ncbi:MAG: hypothetical protein IPG07_07485, partial [Crocinitomicaceae bacterium]|nr:hypothetical protein [Crocinitomicaceae bacterium]
MPPVGVNNYTVRSADSYGTNQCSSEASVFVVVNKVLTNAAVEQASNNKNSSINLEPSGGTFPYSYYWTKDGTEISRNEDVFNLTSGTYQVIVVDAIGCSATQSFTIGNTLSSGNQSQGLKAEMSSDQIYLKVSYSGLLDYKIVNDLG